MELDKSLIKEFVSVTNDTDASSKENTVYGTIVEYNGALCAQFDGSNMVTPVLTTTKVKVGDRVRITLKDHTATVTGNLSDPSASSEEVKELDKKVANFDIVIADIVTTEELNAEVAKIDKAIMDKADIKYATIENLTAANGEIDKLKTDKLDADTADIKYATIENLKAANGEIDNLKADKADVSDLNATNATIENLGAKYANIDFTNIGKAAMEYFYSKSGLIDNVVVGDATIAGKLVGVELNADLITTGSLVADRLVIKGEDGIYYKLNVEGGVTSSEEVTDEELQNGLHGDIFIAKSITAEKINVKDLVAFDATIGGFNITDGSIYSGAKESVSNTTRGIYQDKEGQIAIGDATNFLKYYRTSNGSYKLEISADSVLIGAAKKSVETMINDIDIGGRNLLRHTGKLPIATTTHSSDGISKWYNTGLLESTEDGLKLSYAVDNQSTLSIPLAYDGCIESNETVSISFLYRTNITNFVRVFFLQRASSNVSIWLPNQIVANVGTEWQKYECTFVATNANAGTCYQMMLFYSNLQKDGEWIEIKKGSLKLERGNKVTDWSPALEDTDKVIEDSAKTATNFLSYDAADELQVGNKQSGSWTGFRAQIKSTAFNILNAAGEICASYGAKLIELGKNAKDAVIKMCGGKGKIEYGAINPYTGEVDPNDENGYLKISSDKVEVSGDVVGMRCRDYTLHGNYGEEGSGLTGVGTGVELDNTIVNIWANDRGAASWDESAGDYVSFGGAASSSSIRVQTSGINFEAPRLSMFSYSDIDIYGAEGVSIGCIGDLNLQPSGKILSNRPVLIGDGKTGYNDGVPGWYFGIDGTTHVTRDTYGGYMYFHYNKSTSNTSSIGESSPGVISINGMPYGLNQILWSSDGYWMTANQTITLSQKISDQVNGVMLVFSRYLQDQTAAQNYNFTTCFVPKHQVNFHSGKGHMFTLASDSSFGLFGGKYLYISDTSIKGFDANQTSGTAASGIKYTNTSFVLRYVIGM